jgi:hypothetical protein
VHPREVVEGLERGDELVGLRELRERGVETLLVEERDAAIEVLGRARAHGWIEVLRLHGRSPRGEENADDECGAERDHRR